MLACHLLYPWKEMATYTPRLADLMNALKQVVVSSFGEGFAFVPLNESSERQRAWKLPQLVNWTHESSYIDV